MIVNKEKIINSLGLRHFGSKGWYSSDEARCPVCNKSDKFGILFTDKGGVAHCFRECGENISLYSYLKKIGRDDLIDHSYEPSISNKISELKSTTEENIELPEVVLPKGYTNIRFDEYLSSRGFKTHQYEQFEVGFTDHFLEKKLHDNLIFVIKQKGRRVAWLARSKKDKDWHKKNLENFKEGNGKLVLRYRNSENTDFERILGGFDEITPDTHTVIAVEGIFDKINVSNLLETEKSDDVKVVFTFGDKFSAHQIELLRETNVDKVILMYDPNTIRQSKKYALELSKYFEVDVCYIADESVDPGNIGKKLLSEILKSSKNFLYFYTSKVNATIKTEK